ncbi:choice-of-anchor A family protein [Stigmatella aurantiaca]|uniref:choice-of-anchor A family protein n=1 Tax=Stigmatella aurantiaca TaxID=41 RepID=UPI001FE2CE66|nr:choice-of-anchor A family protein [Stigmatella aurantiaca]
MAVLLTLGWAACGGEREQEHVSPSQQSLTQAGSCKVQPPFTSSFEPELEWEWKRNDSRILPGHDQVMMTPVVIELNGDGIPDVVFNAFAGEVIDSGVVRAISGADGSDLWTVSDERYRVHGPSHIAAGDIDHDGKPEVCTIPKGGKGVICFEHDGSYKFRTPGDQPDNRRGGPSLADLDRDGNVEILSANHVFTHTGALKWVGAGGVGGFPYQGGFSFAADIDGDGVQEVINNRSIYRANGSSLCRNDDIEDGLVGVGNFDAGPFGEIVVVGKAVTLLNDKCKKMWTKSIPGGGFGGPPNIADFDGDGKPEIGVAGETRYSVFKANGALLWSKPTHDTSSGRTGSSSFDFEGDGRFEVVYADEDRLRIYDGRTGTVRFEVPHASGTVFENPVIVDVDGDNNAEIVVASNNYKGHPGVAGIRVYRDRKDGWVNARPIWNQHAYSVTNVNDDGTIPAQPVTNWLVPGLNTFRSNSQGTGSAHPFAASDLVASEVGVSCGANASVTLSARVSNQGEAAASAGLKVAFFQGNPASGGTLLGVATLPRILAVGDSAIASLRWAPAPGGTAEIFAVADYGTGSGRELECREDNNTASAKVNLACPACIEVRLSDYNLFLQGDYTQGTDVEGKVAAGGNIAMTHFAVGFKLSENQIAQTLVAGGDLTLSNGGIWGDAWYGGSYNADSGVLHPRGTLAQGSPIDFAARGGKLRALSSALGSLTANGTVQQPWGVITLSGSDPQVNVFQMSAGSFTGATQLSIQAPAGSLAVINILGSSATFTGFSTELRGGIDKRRVLYNFVDATAITAEGFGFQGTVLAPFADIQFSNGSFDGGIYARSLTGNAEGHFYPLYDRDICR